MGIASIAIVIIGAAMLYGLFRMINEERAKEGKNSLGCIATIIIAALVITFWVLIN